MEEKQTPEEILREQLELLAERSNDCGDDELPGITSAMVEIYHVITARESGHPFGDSDSGLSKGQELKGC